MRKKIILLICLCALMGGACAVDINLSSDKKEIILSPDVKEVYLKFNESIRFDLNVVEPGQTGGAFTISREVKENTYKLVGSPHFVVKSCGCKGTSEVVDIHEYMIFTPLSPGKYRADATYGGHVERIDFYVEAAPNATKPTTTITSTRTSTIASTTTTTTVQTTTTYLVGETTTTMTTQPSTTTTLEAVATPAGGCGCQKNYLLLIAIPLALAVVYFGSRIVSRRQK